MKKYYKTFLELCKKRLVSHFLLKSQNIRRVFLKPSNTFHRRLTLSTEFHIDVTLFDKLLFGFICHIFLYVINWIIYLIPKTKMFKCVSSEGWVSTIFNVLFLRNFNVKWVSELWLAIVSKKFYLKFNVAFHVTPNFLLSTWKISIVSARTNLFHVKFTIIFFSFRMWLLSYFELIWMKNVFDWNVLLIFVFPINDWMTLQLFSRHNTIFHIKAFISKSFAKAYFVSRTNIETMSFLFHPLLHTQGSDEDSYCTNWIPVIAFPVSQLKTLILQDYHVTMN